MAAKYKLQPGKSFGALDAENDVLLEQVFVDTGYIERLSNPVDPTFLILGRTGTGKTALLKRIRQTSDNVVSLNPESLSMQYLHSSQFLRGLTSWGINLDIFYKYLWRHICILELIRMRYGGDNQSPPGWIDKIFRRKEVKAQEVSTKYLADYEGEYWIRSERLVRQIVEEVHEKLGSKLGTEVSAGMVKAGGSYNGEVDSKVQVRSEEVKRVQDVVSAYLVTELQRVTEELRKHAFGNKQQSYLILIDDLDKNWMPDDELYVQLIKSLLFTVNDVNRALDRAKVIVSLRENIYQRVFAKPGLHEPQREKWADVTVRVSWTPAQLEEMANQRLAFVFRGQYTNEPPTLRSILPQANKRNKVDGVTHMLSRTRGRPRDCIQFLNMCFGQNPEVSRLSWTAVHAVEKEYSAARLESVYDEWRDSYYGLQAVFPLLRELGPRFSTADITESHLTLVVCSEHANGCEWLKRTTSLSPPACALGLVRACFVVGILGVKQSAADQIAYVSDARPDDDALMRGTLHVNPTFHAAFGFREEQIEGE